MSGRPRVHFGIASVTKSRYRLRRTVLGEMASYIKEISFSRRLRSSLLQTTCVRTHTRRKMDSSYLANLWRIESRVLKSQPFTVLTLFFFLLLLRLAYMYSEILYTPVYGDSSCCQVSTVKWTWKILFNQVTRRETRLNGRRDEIFNIFQKRQIFSLHQPQPFSRNRRDFFYGMGLPPQ